MTVTDVLEYLAAGMTEQEILADFPDLTSEDIKACLAFAATENESSPRYRSMKLLFDQNLSPRLVGLLADIYPDCMHVRDIGLRDADDVTIWDYAGVHGYTIVAKDSDFQQRSLLVGSPPKFIWLRVGNCTVALISYNSRNWRVEH